MKDNQSQGKNVAGGLFWTFMERIAAQAVSLIVGIILARLLTPDEYGIVAIVMIFITLCDVFVTSGFGTALVQKKEVSVADYDTAFWLSLTISVVLYFVLYVSAPLIAKFYEIELLKPVIRVFGIRLILTSVNTIQTAKVQREMAFKKFFISTFAGTVLSCAVGVGMAYAGYGVWALVAQYLSNTFVATALFSFVCGWRPRFQFSWEKAKEIWRFGSRVLGASLVSTGTLEIQNLMIGKCFGAADLAVMDQGKKYPALLVNNINSSINKVMLPYFSKTQDNIQELKENMRRIVKLSSFIISPILLGLFAVAPIFVEVFLTSKWSACIPYIQIFCIMFLTRPLTTICHQALLAINKADIAMYLMIVINAVALGGAFISAIIIKEMLFIAIFLLVADLVALIGFMIATKACLSWSLKEQLADIIPPTLISVVMCACVYMLPYIVNISGIFLMVLQIVGGAAVYIGLSALFRIDSFVWLLTKIKAFINKKR